MVNLATPPYRISILPAERARRVLDRLAYEVIERNRGADTLEIAGIRARGLALAEALAARIAAVSGREFQVCKLDVAAYRDDRSDTSPNAGQSHMPVEIAGRDLLLVDDVIFTGRTARAALDAVVRYGRPKSIQLMVLVDRGHREYPIQPDYAGCIIPTKHKERVVVEVDDTVAVYLEEYLPQ